MRIDSSLGVEVMCAISGPSLHPAPAVWVWWWVIPDHMGKVITLGVTVIRWKAPRSRTALQTRAVMAAQTSREVNLMLYLSQLLFGGLPAAVVKLISKQMHWAIKFFSRNLEWIPWELAGVGGEGADKSHVQSQSPSSPKTLSKQRKLERAQ